MLRLIFRQRFHALIRRAERMRTIETIYMNYHNISDVVSGNYTFCIKGLMARGTGTPHIWTAPIELPRCWANVECGAISTVVVVVDETQDSRFP